MTFFKNFYILSIVELVLAQVFCLVLLSSVQIATGLFVGWALLMITFVTWHIIVKITNGFRDKKRIHYAIMLGLAKYAVIIGGVFLLLKFNLLELTALIIGIAMVFPCLFLALALKPRLDTNV